MKLVYCIDFESWVFPEDQKFLNLSSEERKKIDNEYVLKSGYALLDLLERKKQKLTFFVIAQIYEWYPRLIQDIARAGHEIALHTYSHKILKSNEALKEELYRSKKFVEDFKIKGFQAPAIFFPEGGYKILAEAGLQYSSSIYTYNDKIYKFDGVKEMPVTVFKYFVNKEEEIKFPMPIRLSKLVTGIPIGSSYFTAILGGKMTAKIIKKMEKREVKFVNLFIHNWQIFPPENASFPSVGYLLKKPLYLPYLKNIRKDFEYLLDNFKFEKLSEFLGL